MNEALEPVVPRSIGVVCAYFWPENLGCAVHVTDLAVHLAKQGHAVDVFSAIPHYPRKSGLAYREAPPGSDHGRLKISRAWVFDRCSGGLIVRLLNDGMFACQTALSLLRRKTARDAVIVVAPPVLALAVVRLLRPRTRIIAAIYDIESKLAQATGIVSNSIVGKILDRTELWCLNRADAVLVLTVQMESALRTMGVMGPITVNPVWPAVARTSLVAATRPRTLMYSGGLNRRHGIDLLPAVWRELHDRMPECQLIVQGDGTERDLIEAELAEVGGNVSVRPPVDRSVLAESLSDGDLQLVLTSGEAADFTIPSKAITALGVGVPFLTNAPAGSALADFACESGGGMIVPSGRAAELASAARELLSSPERLRSMARAGMEYVAREFDSGRLLRVYENLLTQNVS